MSRTIQVAPSRIDVWLGGFAERHGQYDATREDTPGGVVVRVAAPDGTRAVLTPFEHDPLAVLLVRRRGYAVAMVRGMEVVAAKVGTRHVQGRTAAGGWSQQRFARRRANQADELVGAVREHAVRLLISDSGSMPPTGLLVGGDRTLARGVLDDRRLTGLAELPRREFYDIPDPTRKVLVDVIRRGRSYRVDLHEDSPQPS